MSLIFLTNLNYFSKNRYEVELIITDVEELYIEDSNILQLRGNFSLINPVGDKGMYFDDWMFNVISFRIELVIGNSIIISSFKEISHESERNNTIFIPLGTAFDFSINTTFEIPKQLFLQGKRIYNFIFELNSDFYTLSINSKSFKNLFTYLFL